MQRMFVLVPCSPRVPAFFDEAEDRFVVPKRMEAAPGAAESPHRQKGRASSVPQKKSQDIKAEPDIPALCRITS